MGVAEGGGRGDPMGCGQMLEDLEVSSHLLEHIIHIHIYDYICMYDYI